MAIRKFTNTSSFRRKDNPRFWGRVFGAKRKDARLEFGILPEQGREKYDDGASVAEVAAWNHEGTSTIPARPFLTLDPGVVKAKLKWVSEQFFAGKGTNAEALEHLGKWAVSQVKKKINDGVPPPNAPATIAKKGFDHPLIETRKLLRSITSKVSAGAK